MRAGSPPLTRSLLAGLCAVVSVLSWSGPAHASPHASASVEAEFDADAAADYVAGYLDRHGLPGAAYAVVKDGRAVSAGAAGDVTADTAMAVASVSKSFTAFAVLQLVDHGEVELDAAVTDYLPSFSVRGADSADITVRMLLDHTSGVPNPLIVPATGSLARDVEHIAQLEVSSAPGTSYLYSNLNYRALAYLVQVVSGEAFDAYLGDHVFAPLGMRHTTSVISSTGSGVFDDGHVTAYGTSLRIPEMARDVAGSGGVVSTARDMSRWLGMQQRGGITAEGDRLLSSHLVEESHTVQPGAGTYGLGWQHTSTAEPPRVGHDGALTRSSARVDLVPSSGYGVVVLLNSYTPTYQHPFTISTGLIELSEGNGPEQDMPIATIIDLSLAALTMLVALLGVRGILRSRRWADRRAGLPGWRYVLRQLPQAIMPVGALILFVGLTVGPGNPATPVDAFGLWPAATTLVLVAGVVGVVLIAVRAVRWASARVSLGRGMPSQG